VNRDLHCIASREQWLEETGEVELIGGWAEIPLAADFAAAIGAPPDLKSTRLRCRGKAASPRYDAPIA
jgi:hypothetical protein